MNNLYLSKFGFFCAGTNEINTVIGIWPRIRRRSYFVAVVRSVLLVSLVIAKTFDACIAQGFEVSPAPEVWKNSDFEANPQLLDEYTYASIDIVIVNPKALLNLKFNNPPQPNGPRREVRKWENEQKQRLRYLSVSLNFPVGDNPWGRELVLPMYIIDCEKSNANFTIQQVSTILDNVPRSNVRYRKLNATLKIEKKAVNEIESFVGQVSDLALNFISDPVALTTPALLTTITPEILKFKNMLNGGNKEYVYNYKMQILPFGSWKQGVVRQVDLYTIKPIGETTPVPSLSQVRHIKDANDVIKQLSINEKYPQIAVVYRSTYFNFEDFDPRIGEIHINAQKQLLADYKLQNLISQEEEEQLDYLVKMKEELLKMEKDKDMYHEKINARQSYTGDLINAMSKYYNFRVKLLEMESKYAKTKLYNAFNKKNGSNLRALADASLKESVAGRNLERALGYCDALVSHSTRKLNEDISTKYTRLNLLKYLDAKELKEQRSYEKDIKNSTLHENGKGAIDELDQEIYSLKYAAQLDTLNGSAPSDKAKKLRDRLKASIEKEISNYSILEVNKAIELYDKKELDAVSNLKAKQLELDQVMQDAKKLAIVLSSQENCLQRQLNNPDNGLETHTLEIYNNYFKNYKKAKADYINKGIEGISKSDLNAMEAYIRTITELKNKLDLESSLFKDATAFLECFNVR